MIRTLASSAKLHRASPVFSPGERYHGASHLLSVGAVKRAHGAWTLPIIVDNKSLVIIIIGAVAFIFLTSYSSPSRYCERVTRHLSVVIPVTKANGEKKEVLTSKVHFSEISHTFPFFLFPSHLPSCIPVFLSTFFPLSPKQHFLQ